MPVERLQKVLASAGVSSRRHAEDYIRQGRVRVNGIVVTELGTRVDPRRDKIELDGKRIVHESPVYAILHKPRGVVTTLNDPEGRPALGEFVKSLGARVFPVGRLDYHTSGALLVTNDGALAQALAHPRHHVPKVYVCKVRGVPSDLQLDAWRKGVMLHPTESDPDERQTKTLPAQVRILRNAPPGDDAGAGAGSTWLEVTLHEGRTRQIHRMAEATGLFVMRLARLSFAEIDTEGLRPGDMRPLTDKEVTALRVKYLRPVEMGGIPPIPSEPKVEKKKRFVKKKRGPTPDPEMDESSWIPREDVAPAPERAAAPRAGARPPRRDARPVGRDAAPRRDDARPPRRDARPVGRDTAPRRDDARPPRRDARPVGRDTAPRRDDARPPRRDARPVGRDTAPRRDDARPPRRDAAPRRDDARPPRRDAAPRRDDARPVAREARPERRGAAPRRDDARPRRDDARPRRDDAPPARTSAPPRGAASTRPAAPARRRDDRPSQEGERKPSPRPKRR
jgi:23S rRNA pseudouridine2605 synthase